MNSYIPNLDRSLHRVPIPILVTNRSIGLGCCYNLVLSQVYMISTSCKPNFMLTF
ncbi:MAG: hypothetical protein NVS4B12_24580 [Ktedonobacteraceae bacterium]